MMTQLFSLLLTGQADGMTQTTVAEARAFLLFCNTI